MRRAAALPSLAALALTAAYPLVAQDSVAHHIVDGVGHVFLKQGERPPIHRVGECIAWSYAGAWT